MSNAADLKKGDKVEAHCLDGLRPICLIGEVTRVLTDQYVEINHNNIVHVSTIQKCEHSE